MIYFYTAVMCNTYNIKGCNKTMNMFVRKSDPSEFEILTSQSLIGLSDGLFCHNLSESPIGSSDVRKSNSVS